MGKILIVDDEEHIRQLIGEILTMRGYECILAGSAAEARSVLGESVLDLILCDINMPGESGLDFMRHALKICPNTAAVMVTAIDDPMVAEDALSIGVYDYITKPFELNGVLISVANALRRRQLEIDNKAYRDELERQVAERTAALQESEARLRAIFEAAAHVTFIMIDRLRGDDLVVEFSPAGERMLGYTRDEVIGKSAAMFGLPGDVLRAPAAPDSRVEREIGFTREVPMVRKTGEHIPMLFTSYPIFDARGALSATLVVCVDISERKKAEEQLEESMEKLGKALEGSIRAIARTVETRDPYTAGHQQRVADLACSIAREMNLPPHQVEGIRMGGVIHDLGKVSIPAGILSKPGRISSLEFELIKTHPTTGYEILKTIEFPWPIARMVLQHHERLNGSGYPSGIGADEILLEARILGVADVVEAMASHRPYRPALGIERALKEVEDHKGTLYDANVVDVCVRIFREKRFSLD